MSEMVTMEGRNRLNDFIDRMKAKSLPDEAYVKVGENDDGTALTMIAPVFKYAVERGKKTEIQITDKNVAQIMYDLQAAHGAGDEIARYVARKVYQLSKYDEVIKRMNFDSAIDLYSTVFGVSKDMASKRLRVGKYFLVGDDLGQIEYVPYIPKGWTLSHLQELLQYLPKDENGMVDDSKVAPTVVKWLSEGTLSDGMTTKKVREALNNLLPEGSRRGRKASKKQEGKQEGAQEGAQEGKQAQSDVDATVIDRLDGMPIDALVGHAINALDVLKAVFPRFNLDEGDAKAIGEALEFMRDIAHAQVKG